MAVLNDRHLKETQTQALLRAKYIDNLIRTSVYLHGPNACVQLTPDTANEIARILGYFASLRVG